MRAVKCVVGSYGAVMDDTECNAATRPTDTQVRKTLTPLLLASLSLQTFSLLLFTWSLNVFLLTMTEKVGAKVRAPEFAD